MMEIGHIGSAHGGLEVFEREGKYYWGVWYHSGIYVEEIPESLYLELLKFNETVKDETDTLFEGNNAGEGGVIQ